MKRKPKRIILDGIEFDLPKVGEGTGKRYEIIHTASGRSLRVQFIQRCEAEAFLTSNIARIRTQIEAVMHQLRKQEIVK